MVNVADGEGNVIARSIIKLTSEREVHDFDSKTKKRTILVEKPYTLLHNPEIFRAFFRLLLAKAQGLESSITLGTGYDEDTLKIFEEEATAAGFIMRKSRHEVYIPKSVNPYEYSDSLGGKNSYFNRYHEVESVIFEPEQSGQPTPQEHPPSLDNKQGF